MKKKNFIMKIKSLSVNYKVIILLPLLILCISGVIMVNRMTAKDKITPSQNKSALKIISSKPNDDITSAFLPSSSSQIPAAVSSQSEIPAKTFHGSTFNNTSQIIVVTASGLNTIYAELSTYLKSNGIWSQVMSFNARVGKYGLVYDDQRVEGDMRTPIGIYTLPYAFGTAVNPGTKMPYKSIDSNTYYDGEYGSPTYNNFVEVKPANSEFEYMDIGPYQYGLDINFNPTEIVGKGNAIFLHCSTASGYTAGCVSISPANMVTLLLWLDPSQNPQIIICTDNGLNEYYF